METGLVLGVSKRNDSEIVPFCRRVPPRVDSLARIIAMTHGARGASRDFFPFLLDRDAGICVDVSESLNRRGFSFAIANSEIIKRERERERVNE